MAFASSLSSPPEILFFLLLFTPIPLFPSHFCPSHFFFVFPSSHLSAFNFSPDFPFPPTFFCLSPAAPLAFPVFLVVDCCFFGGFLLAPLFPFPIFTASSTFLSCCALPTCFALPVPFVLNAFRPPLPVPPLPPSLHFFLPWLPLEFFRSSFFSFWCSSFSFPL